uniref:Uncharacterized protein n=1 Tax=Anguilla anguilla TaxID=7936 RepID=A0A0E9Q5N0_ANGAN
MYVLIHSLFYCSGTTA